MQVTRSRSRNSSGEKHKSKNERKSSINNSLNDNRFEIPQMTPKAKFRKTSSGEASLDRTRESYLDRDFFSLKEDSIIINYWLQNKTIKTVDTISESLTGIVLHSSKSISDRIKRYLSKLSNFDHEYIIDESQVIY